MAEFQLIGKGIRALVAAVVLLAFSIPVSADETVDFELPDIDGNMYRLSDYRGDWVIVNFWATWCGPCVREIPILREISKMTDPVQPVVIGIDFEEIEEGLLRAAIEKLNIDYLVLLIGDTPLIPFEPLKGLPSTFIVSPQGELVYSHAGEIKRKMLVDTLQRLAQAS